MTTFIFNIYLFSDNDVGTEQTKTKKKRRELLIFKARALPIMLRLSAAFDVGSFSSEKFLPFWRK